MRTFSLLQPLQALRQNMRDQPLSYRILGSTLLWSLLVTTLAVVAQLYVSWRADLAQIEGRLDEIEKTYVPSLVASLWSVDNAQVDLLLDGILRLPEISAVKLSSPDSKPIVRGQSGDALFARSYALIRKGERVFELGELKVSANRNGVVQRLRERALGIFASEAMTIFLVSMFVFALFQRRVNRHLRLMAGYARHLDVSSLGEPLILDRLPSVGNPDEIEQVADAINRMRERLRSDFEARSQAEAEVQQHRDHLEELVSMRTAELQLKTQLLESQSNEIRQARDRAELTLTRLQTAQQQLVEAEKMASLGQLVAGVAHEVNTPLGVALTASSFVENQAQDMRRMMTEGGLSRSALQTFVETMSKSAELIQQNLQRAAHLIQSFKQVSVDRTSDGRRQFEVSAFTDALVASLRTLWRHRRIEVKVNCQAGLKMDSFPGALGSVITNLIQNALVHAFTENGEGVINVKIEAEVTECLLLTVQDNGVGIETENLSKIFEPFFTTKRGQGGTGLGLHLVYNLVTQKLGGRVEVSSVKGEGSCFKVFLPCCAPLNQPLV